MDAKDRINFVSKHYFRRIKFGLGLICLASTSVIVLQITLIEFNYISLGLALGLFLFCAILSSTILKKTRIASIKGDTLIVQNSSKRNTAMSIRSVKTVTTKNILGIWHTTIHYILDGQSRKFFILSWARGNSSPEKIIKENIERVNKKKANHKPGSVITQA